MPFTHLSSIRIVLTIVTAILTVLGVSTRDSHAQVFHEDFNNPAGATGYVAFDGNPLFTKAIPGPSTGGDATGNFYEDGLIVTNSGVITNDQTGNGYFLYANTRCIDVFDLRAEVWGTLTPVPVTPGASYVFSFYLTNRDTNFIAQIEPRINGVAIASPVSALGTWPGQQWQRFVFSWTAPSGTTSADLSLFDQQPECFGNNFGIDSISFAPAGCGDGIVQSELGEQCDDGNNSCCDGCDRFCHVESCDGKLKSLFVLDGGPNPVLRFDAATHQFVDQFLTAGAGGIGTPAGGGDGSPVDIAAGPNGDVFVLLHFGGRVLRFDGCTGTFLGNFIVQDPQDPDRVDGAHSLTFGPDGDLYVLAVHNGVSRVMRFDGVTGAALGRFGTGDLSSNPERLAFGPYGELYVTGNASQRVYRFDSAGNSHPSPNYPATAIFAALTNRNALGLVSDGIDVYVGTEPSFGSGSASIKRFDTNGVLVSEFSGTADGLARAFDMDFGPGGELNVVTGDVSNLVLRYSGAGSSNAFLGGFAPQGTGGMLGPAALAFSCACHCPSVADLKVEKTVNNPSPNAGASVTFQVVVTNNGPGTATHVVVLDVLPPGLTYTSHTIAGSGAYDPVTGRLSIANLAPQTSASLTITAVVNSCLAVTNCASLSTHDGSDPNSSNDSACVTVTPAGGTCADVGGIKFGDQDRNGVKAAGEPLIENQIIVLKKGGQIVQTKPTNNAGSYAFFGLLPGTYEITEVLLPGQVVITPSGGSKSVNVSGPASIVGEDFGNYTCDPFVPNTCIRPPTGLAEWWPLDSIVSGTAGCAHTIGMVRHKKDRVFGSPAGAAACGATSPASPGAVDGAINFDGVDDYIEAADAAVLNFRASTGPARGDFSIDAWIKTTATAPQMIVDKRVEQSGAEQGYAFFTQDGFLRLRFASAGVAVEFSSIGPLVNTGVWTHVTVTVNRDAVNGVKFYVNAGPPTNSANPTAQLGDLINTKPLRIGRRSDNSAPGFFTGGLDEVEIFRRVLTQQEIQDIKDRHKCKRPNCHLPKLAKLCKTKQKIQIPFTICNYSGVPDSFTWSIAGLPTSTSPKCDVTPTNFTPIGGVTKILNPGQCTTVVTKMVRPADLVAPGVACFQTTFASNSSGQCYRCKGSVKANDRSCTKKPAAVALQSVLPLTQDTGPSHVEFQVENTQDPARFTGGDPNQFDYQFTVVESEGELPNEVVSLNGLAPGVPVSGSVVIAPGATQTIGVDVEFLELDTFDFYDLVLESDADGDDVLEDDDSAGLRSVVEGAMPPDCDGALPSSTIALGWTSTSRMTWNTEACSSIYNVYRATTDRFTDANLDSLADDYGACFDPEATVAETYDDSAPPIGSFHAYLVSGKNPQGEGTLGTNRAGALRPMPSPCP